MTRSNFHILLHLLVPLAVALVFFRARWQRAAAVMIATMVVDLDHLLAVPLYDPDRCSINTHPLHTPVPIALYVVLALHPRTRLVGIGFVLHMALDSADCWQMGKGWLGLG